MFINHQLRPLFLGLMITAALSTQALAAVPFNEMITSQAGRLIFGELIEGSLVANRVLGTNVANPGTRVERLAEALSNSRMQSTTKELEARMNRIYKDFAARNPKSADELFRGKPEAESAAPSSIDAADRRLLRDLVSREFDRSLLDTLATNFEGTRERFLQGEEVSETGESRMSAQEKALVFWETQKNAAGIRSNVTVAIEHFEIPLDMVEADLADRIAPELRDSLIFEKNGKKHVRWIINPEDTKHYKAVERFLKSKGADATHYTYFEAHQTASRSYILVDPASDRHVVFSAKVSTNNTGGAWRDKKQPFEDAFEARRATDFVRAQEAQRPFQNIVTMDEPAMFGLKQIDQAMLVRVLGDMPEGDVTYLPGFSAMHGDLGVRIAHANGYEDVAAFWNEHYNKPLGRALAELAARTGLTFDSPHSQNFLVEMVGVNPTGRIVLRDFGDTYALGDFFEASGNKDFLKRWEKDNITHGNLDASVGVLHGNEMPDWMNESLYRKWGTDFYQAWESEFSAQTGIPQKLLEKTRMTQNGRYFSKNYPTSASSWASYFKGLKLVPLRGSHRPDPSEFP